MNGHCSENNIKQESPHETDYEYKHDDMPISSEEPSYASSGFNLPSTIMPYDCALIKQKPNAFLSSDRTDVDEYNEDNPELNLKVDESRFTSESSYQSESIKQEPELIIESDADELPADHEETNATNNQVDSHRCYLCGQTFADSESCDWHLTEHLDMLPYECEICTHETGIPVKIAASLVQLHRHVKMHTNRFKCPKCPLRSKTKQSLREHVRLKHGGNDEDKHTCTVCGKQMTRKYLMRHKREHESLEQGRFKCSVCGKMFKTRQCLSVHERLHTEEHPYQCKFCPKTFKNLGTFIGHERIHTGEKPYTCQVCGKTYRWLVSLKSHLEAAHGTSVETATKPADSLGNYKCEFEGCDYNTTKRAQLSHHRAKHRMKFQCETCSKKFATGNELRSHENTHKTTKDYHCEQCSKSFRTKRYLEKHMAVHSKIRPFECQTCGEAYLQKKQLTKHLLRNVECQKADQVDVEIEISLNPNNRESVTVE
ncbi:zinc finger protein 761-like isoform X2 [Aedes albopictus]|uniref:C2H2-type domain-containing protein n=1 Tax=Aedes albopictus TaxID=7160 RepID=A0ABM1Y317_AEDAL